MANQNDTRGKYMQGTFSQGEGPVLGQSVDYQGEDKSIIAGGEGGGKNLTQVSGLETMKGPTPGGDNLFSLRGANYCGPQNFTPNDKGTVNPFDIKNG